ncbi:MAG: NAD(P)H-hydrate dehydratase, partial [Gammaproteobacteria bacterium]|nr:NAD(P)H-hydrate dehydratase [Gammaproteobacteria bacterium]
SLDIPSGLHADTGQAMGACVRATATVTFIGLKPGLFTGAGPGHAGRILFAGLDVPQEIYSGIRPACYRIDYESQKHCLGERRRDAHKGDFGHVLVAGGDYGFPGSVRLAAEAAARVGSGLVSVATRPEHAALIPLARPELMARGVTRASDLAPLLERATVIALGPGLGQSSWGTSLFARLLEARLPKVLDADALRLLAKEPVRSEDWVLTPHPGEAAELLQIDTAAVQADRFHAAQELRERYGGVVVLKGAGTVVVAGEDPCVCSDGNPGMASGGMGDVLTGVIAGLLAQGAGPERSACFGVCLHAAAADRASEDGTRGLLAGDLMPWLRRLVN